MSATHPDRSLDSGHNHLMPLLIAAIITVATVAVALAFTGLPH